MRPMIVLAFAQILFATFFSTGALAYPYAAPSHRMDPEVLDVVEERYDGYESYGGYFWTHHGFIWTAAKIAELRRDFITLNSHVIYEFRRGFGNDAAANGPNEHWDGAWALDETRCKRVLIFNICWSDQVTYTEYVTSLPGAENSGMEEHDGWFTRVPNHFPFEAPPSWGFDMCDITERGSGGGCDEEYEVSGEVSDLEPNRYYFVSIKFRTDLDDGTLPTEWNVSYGLEIGDTVAYTTLSTCRTDTGNWSIDPRAFPPVRYVSPHTRFGDCTDGDNDGSPDSRDNCLDEANPDQSNRDSDRLGDACDPCPDDPENDSDGDGICGNVDPFPDDPGNDADGDGLVGSADNCPNVSNSDQRNTDVDTTGDACDTDDDNDGVTDTADAFPLDPDESSDIDGDGTGDNADADDDGDGYSDTIELSIGSDPGDPLSVPPDSDGDLLPDIMDVDDDNDGVNDPSDDFPLDAGEYLDSDGDGTGDNADIDDDNDGFSDADETAAGSDPRNPFSMPGGGGGSATDNDLDGIEDSIDLDDDNDLYADTVEAALGTDSTNPLSAPADNDDDLSADTYDTDDDNDGVADISDALPFNGTESVDTDGDSIGDNADLDDDNDGYSDAVEAAEGTDPLSSSSTPPDLDLDHDPDRTDPDDDGDGVADVSDAYPRDPAEWTDTDGDGIGNNADSDDDNDLMPDSFEISYGLNPLANDTAGDRDGDQFSNYDEYYNGTNPSDAGSFPPFCGSSRMTPCGSSSQCNRGGCSLQVCKHVEESIVTVCDAQTCYNPGLYGLTCGCFASKCQWR